MPEHLSSSECKEVLDNSRMVGGEVAFPTANPKPYVKVSLHTAPQCMVIVIDTGLRHPSRVARRDSAYEERRDYSEHCSLCSGLCGRSLSRPHL